MTLLHPQYGQTFRSIEVPVNAPNAPGTDAIRIWALLSSRVGDNAQVMALMDALRLPYDIKAFDNRVGAIGANLLFGPRLPWMVKTSRGLLDPPWPHLVVAAGTQSEPICTLIRDHARRDGHQVQSVFLGRPWEDISSYDLVVTTPQYKVPPGPNVMQIDLPLHRVTAEAIELSASAWNFRLAHLPRPYIAVIMGGGSVNRYTLDRNAVRRLACQADELARAVNGSLLISTSFRTPSWALETLAKNIRQPSYTFDWQESPADNPYLAFLGLADAIVVTGDSITMLAEACETRKPVYIFDLGEGRFSMRQGDVKRDVIPRHRPDLLTIASTIRAFRKDLKVRAINRILPERLHRDTRPILNMMVESGAAAWLGDLSKPSGNWPSQGKVNEVVGRVLALLQTNSQAMTSHSAETQQHISH